jgi:hypothetical protein
VVKLQIRDFCSVKKGTRSGLGVLIAKNEPDSWGNVGKQGLWPCGHKAGVKRLLFTGEPSPNRRSLQGYSYCDPSGLWGIEAMIHNER